MALSFKMSYHSFVRQTDLALFRDLLQTTCPMKTMMDVVKRIPDIRPVECAHVQEKYGHLPFMRHHFFQSAEPRVGRLGPLALILGVLALLPGVAADQQGQRALATRPDVNHVAVPSTDGPRDVHGPNVALPSTDASLGALTAEPPDHRIIDVVSTPDWWRHDPVGKLTELIESGVDVDTRDDDGWSPLMFCTYELVVMQWKLDTKFYKNTAIYDNWRKFVNRVEECVKLLESRDAVFTPEDSKIVDEKLDREPRKWLERLRANTKRRSGLPGPVNLYLAKLLFGL